MDILQSRYRHLWYLVPQTVVLALADQALAQLSPSLSFVFFMFSLKHTSKAFKDVQLLNNQEFVLEIDIEMYVSK